MEVIKLPKKLTTNDSYAESAQAFIKAKRKDFKNNEEFFKFVYGREPINNEAQTLANQVNRGKYAADFVGLMIERFGLDNVTLGEFYKGGYDE